MVSSFAPAHGSLCLVLPAAGEAKDNPDYTNRFPIQMEKPILLGVADLAAYLIRTLRENIMLNANLESSPFDSEQALRRSAFLKDTKASPQCQGALLITWEAKREVLRETMHVNGLWTELPMLCAVAGAKTVPSETAELKHPPARVDQFSMTGYGSPRRRTLTRHRTGGLSCGYCLEIPHHISSDPSRARLRNVVMLRECDHFRSTPGSIHQGQPALPGNQRGLRQKIRYSARNACDLFWEPMGSTSITSKGDVKRMQTSLQEEAALYWIILTATRTHDEATPRGRGAGRSAKRSGFGRDWR